MKNCGCQRGMWCCEACSLIKKLLEIELHAAMATGDWSEFEKTRKEFEEHMSHETDFLRAG